MTGRRIHGWGVVALAAATVALAAVVVLAIDVGSVRAAVVSRGAGPSVELAAADSSHVTVVSDRGMEARFSDFSPGTSEPWRITATVSSVADLVVRIDRRGVLASRPDGLALAVAACSAAWTADGTCSGSARTILPVTALQSVRFDGPLSVGQATGGRASHLLLTFSMPDSAAARTDDSLMGQSATVGVTVAATGATAGGASGSDGPNGGVRPGLGGAGSDPGSGSGSGPDGGGTGSGRSEGAGVGVFGRGALAFTGSSVAGPAVVGLGLLAGGILLAVRRRRPRGRCSRHGPSGRGL